MLFFFVEVRVSSNPTQYVIILFAIGFFIYRQSRPMKLTLLGLWLLPAFLILISIFSIAVTSLAQVPGIAAPAPLLVAVAVLAGLAAGIPLGLTRGRASTVRLGDTKGTMIVEPSLLFALIWFAAFALRFGLRALIPMASPAYFALSDASLAFAVSAIVALRYVLFGKFKALHLEAAQVLEV